MKFRKCCFQFLQLSPNIQSSISNHRLKEVSQNKVIGAGWEERIMTPIRVLKRRRKENTNKKLNL